MNLYELFTILKGGAGSGNFGHAGRPGKRGGSVSHSIARSLTTGRDAARRQEAAKQKDFFKGNIKTSSMKEIYDNSSQKIKDLADQTGIIPTDKQSLKYVENNIDAFKEREEKEQKIEVDKDMFAEGLENYKKSVPQFRELYIEKELNYELSKEKEDLDFKFRYPEFALTDARNVNQPGYTGRSASYIEPTDKEVEVASKLIKYETVEHSWYGKDMKKAVSNLSQEEKDLLTSYNAKIRFNYNTLGVVTSSVMKLSDKSWEEASDFRGKFNNAAKRLSAPGQNEKVEEYVKRVINHPSNNDLFGKKPPPPIPKVPLNKMIALSNTDPGEKNYFDRRIQRDWDRSNHSSFSGTINNAFRVKNSGEVEAAFNKAAEKYGNVKKNMYHGTDYYAARNIAANGYIVPRSAKAGRMLGDGIYLADKSSKSSQYLGNTFGRSDSSGVLFVNDAAMGNVKNGALYANPGANTAFIEKGRRILNNEWAVKDPKAVIPRYWLDMEIKR